MDNLDKDLLQRLRNGEKPRESDFHIIHSNEISKEKIVNILNELYSTYNECLKHNIHTTSDGYTRACIENVYDGNIDTLNDISVKLDLSIEFKNILYRT